MSRIGSALLGLLIRLLPRPFRDEAGDQIRESFETRQREARPRGMRAVLRAWTVEVGGLLAAAYRSRRPDRWARRTAPPSNGVPEPSTRSVSMTLESLVSDLRFAVRTFVRRPMLALLAVVTLSLGIGASTAMFSIVDSVLLRPLSYPEPEALYQVYPGWPELQGHPTLGDLADRGTWSWPEYFTVSEHQTTFASLAAFQLLRMTWSKEDGPEQIGVAETTWELFPMLGSTPRAGRLFDAGDDLDGGDGVVLASHAFWQSRLGGDEQALGRTLQLGGRPYEIVGILPEGFEVEGIPAALWRPKAGSPTDGGLGNHTGIRAMGRLAEGVSAERAQAEVERILVEQLPPEHGVHDASVFSLQAEQTRTVRPVLYVLLAAAGLLLLVACGNVAALLLGAGIDRERELAVRGSIGASRSRLVRQLLIESGSLALLGALGGLVAAGGAIRGLVYLAPDGVPRLDEAALDPVAVGFAMLLAIACGLTFGAVPALALSKIDLAGAIGSTRTVGGRTRLHAAVVVSELALATLLVAAGSLLVRTVAALNSVDPGFDHQQLALVSIAPSSSAMAARSPEDEQDPAPYYRTLLTEIASVPGVEAVATSTAAPLFGWRGNNAVLPEGWSEEERGPLIAERRGVTPGYFEVLGTPLVEGRGFDERDDAEGAEPTIIVSRGLAELAWPGERAVGRVVSYFGSDATVVGVAENIHDEQLDRSTDLAFYAPASQSGMFAPVFVIRAAADPAAVLTGVRERIRAIDPGAPVTRSVVMSELMSDQIASQRYRARLMAVFAGLAGLFALMGTYGVTARSVARRRRELGVRVALGAERKQLGTLVTGQAVRLAVYGVTVGLLGAAAAGGLLQGFLWGVSRTDPVTFVGVGLALPLAAILSALPSALRATRVDPLEALREE